MTYSEKPGTPEEILHYGVKGMRWGVRKSRSATGISRSRGALIDRNNRMQEAIKREMKSKGTGFNVNNMNRVTNIVSVGGEKRYEKMRKTQIKYLTSQNSRVRSGKLKVRDKFDLFANTLTDPVSLGVSITPKKYKKTT